MQDLIPHNPPRPPVPYIPPRAVAIAQTDPTTGEMLAEMILSIAAILGAVALAGVGILVSIAIAAGLQ